jgi:hypothetical protein
MATRAENLETRLDAIAEELAGLTPYTSPDLPNANGTETIDYVGYRQSLLSEMAMLRKELMAADAFEVTSEMTA